MMDRERIAEAALKLPPEDRLYVADRLEQSLPHGGLAPEIAKAWASEIDRRIEAYDRGETRAVDFDVALGNIRCRLAEHRERKAST